MTDDEQGKAQDAEEQHPPIPSPSPVPSPPDVSMLDAALGPDDVASYLQAPPPEETAVRDKLLSTPSEEELDPLEDDEPALEQSDETIDQDSTSDPHVPAELRSSRQRITLKIPDDAIPKSSATPAVEEAKPPITEQRAPIVQAMRIIAVGEASAPAPEKQVQQLALEDRLDDDTEQGFESQPVASSRNDEELEPEWEEDLVRAPPVMIVPTPSVPSDSPAPPMATPLSPSASAPPPPIKTAARAGAVVLPVPQTSQELSESPPSKELTPAASQDAPADELDEELAPVSDPSVSPTPPTAATSNEIPEERPLGVTPPVAVSVPLPAAPAPSAEPANDIPPAPIRPAKAPPPPKVKPQEREKRPRKGRAGWEEAFTDEFVRAYPRLTPGQVKAEVSFIEESLGIQYGGVVLDLGCGSGQHAVELASRGFNVVGYDLSLTMLAMAADEAQERGQKINFLQGDMREMAFEEVFDGVFSWATSFGFFDDEINASVIQRVHRALRKGGMFLLDLINRDYICSRLPSLVWFEGDGCVCIDDAQFNSITSRLRVKRTIMIEDGTSKEVEYSIRLYSLHEIGRILHETGFKVVEVSGHPATHGAFFDADSPRVITLAVRR